MTDNVSVSLSPGSFGIEAGTLGTGPVTVTNSTNILVTGAGVVSGDVGILAFDNNSTSNAAVTVTTGDGVSNLVGTVAGGTGIEARNIGTNVGATVTVNANADVTGPAGSGIVTRAVNGDTTINVTTFANNTTVTGTGTGNAGITSSATGAGNITVNNNVVSIITGGTTASGIRLSQTGTGSNTINNTFDSQIWGTGTLANPVISSATTNAGTTTINNDGIAGATIRSTNSVLNDQQADLAIFSPVTTGAFIINNNPGAVGGANIVGTVSLTNGADTFNNYSGGAWFVRDGVTNAGVFGLGNDTLNNNAGGHINAGNGGDLDLHWA